MFITALFILISNQRLSKYPLILKWISEMRYIHLLEYYLAITKQTTDVHNMDKAKKPDKVNKFRYKKYSVVYGFICMQFKKRESYKDRKHIKGCLGLRLEWGLTCISFGGDGNVIKLDDGHV